MNSKIKFLTASLVILFLNNLAFGQVSTDFDKTIDFNNYKTYTFKGWEKDSDKQLTDFDKKRITDAFQSEFDSRGLKMDNDNPDMAITLYIVIEEKTSTTAYTDYNGGLGYGPRWGWGVGMGYGSSTTTVSQYDYREGTLVIDFYNEEGKNLIWQGTLKTTIQEKAKKREKTIPKNIGKLMKKYPIKPI